MSSPAAVIEALAAQAAQAFTFDGTDLVIAAVGAVGIVLAAVLGRRTTATTTTTADSHTDATSYDVDQLVALAVAGLEKALTDRDRQLAEVRAEAVEAKAAAAQAKAEVAVLRAQLQAYADRERAMERTADANTRELADLHGRLERLEAFIVRLGYDPDAVAAGTVNTDRLPSSIADAIHDAVTDTDGSD